MTDQQEQEQEQEKRGASQAAAMNDIRHPILDGICVTGTGISDESSDSHPLLSVIIPVYNEEATIALLLEQLVKSPDVEVIICDGGSSDRTLAVCQPYPCHLLGMPRGRGQQLNAGAATARGGLLFFLHADSWLADDWLEQLTTTEAPWGCFTMAFDDPASIYRWIAWGSNLRSRWGGLPFGDQGIFCRRELFISQGGFPEMEIMEDLAFSQRMKKIYPPQILPGLITSSARRFHRGGPLQTLLKMQLLKLLYLLGVAPKTLVKIYRGKEQR